MTANQLFKIMRDEGRRPSGYSARYQQRFFLGHTQPCTRAVQTLRKRGLVDTMTFANGTIAVNLTQEGRR